VKELRRISKKSQYDEFQIDVPRDREGKFEPKQVPKYQRDIFDIDGKEMYLYARGMSTRDIHSQIQKLYGMDIVPNETTALSVNVSDKYEKLQKRLSKWIVI